MEEVNRVALESAIRSLGLPDIIEQSSGDDVFYFGNVPHAIRVLPTLRLTFTIPLTQEIAEYLPNMKERYDIWKSILTSDKPL